MTSEKKSKLWLWILLAVIVIAAVVLLILHPWSAKDGDTAQNPVTTTEEQTGTAENNSIIGQADEAAAAAGEQQNVEIEDSTGMIESIRLQDEIEDTSGSGGGTEAMYSIHLNENANWGADTEKDTETALAVIKQVMEQRANDGYGSCVVYVYQANNCMAFMWFEFNPQYLSMFDAQGNTGDVVVLTDEQVAAVGATIPEF